MPAPLRPLSTRERTAVIAATLLYAAVAIPIGMHKGGDLVTEFAQVERLLHGQPLYDRTAFLGVWWPPFGVLLVVPFALLAHISPDLAKAVWALASALCISWTVTTAARVWGWKAALLALLAVSKPIQTNAEALNVNAFLVALLLAAILDLRNGKDARAGVWIGIATALKAYPALLIVYLAGRGMWRSFGAAFVTAGSLTLAGVLPYGLGIPATIRDWLTLSAGVRVPEWARTSQSVEALVVRLGGSLTAALIARVALVTATAVVLWRRRAQAVDPLFEIGLVTVVAVMVSPVAWDHYYVLFFPAWLALLTARPPAGAGPLWWSAVAIAGTLTSGIVLASLPTWLRWELLLRSVDAWGALLLVLLLVLQRAREDSNLRPTA